MTKTIPPKEELEQCKSYADVCRRYNVSHPTARKWFAHHNLHTQVRIVPKEELEYKYLVEKKSSVVIGKEYGVHPITVLKWLKKHGISTRRSWNRCIVRPSKEELEHKYLVEMKSDVALSKEYGTSPQNIRRWLVKDGIPLRPKVWDDPSKEELVELYTNQHLSTGKIAEMYKCTTSTISRLLAQYEIPVRQHHKFSACRVLKKHAEDLKDDPERLSTKFMQDLIGVKCD